MYDTEIVLSGETREKYRLQQVTQMNNRPVFIISSERSGSNLLRVLLGNHSRISAPRALHLLITFYRISFYYDPLSVKENAKKLFDDFAAIAHHPYHFWNLSLDFDAAYEKYRPKNLLDVFNLFYSEYAAAESKERFVCKENNLFDFSGPLVDYYKDPVFIYLYRDPRDYVASWMNLPVPIGPKTAYSAATRWLREQDICADVISSVSAPVYTLRYEDLITDTKKHMTGILEFLDEPVEEACFEIREGTNSDLSWNVFWKNLNKPVIKQNFKKYTTSLSHPTLTMIETLTKEKMVTLGYTCETRTDWRKPSLFKYREVISSQLLEYKRNRLNTETQQLLANRKTLVQTIVRKRKALSSTSSS